MFRRYVVASYLGIKSAGYRSVLTILGIAMGLFLIITLIAVGEGVREQVTAEMNQLGPDVLSVFVNSNTSESGDPASSLLAQNKKSVLTIDEIDIVKNTDHIVETAPIKYLSGEVKYKDRITTPNYIIATNDNYPEIRNLEFESGGFFRESDDNSSVLDVVIGSATKKSLLSDDKNAVGKILEYKNIKLRVSGVLKEGSSNNESMTQGNPDNILLVPFSVESDNTTKFLYSAILTKVNKVDNVTSAKQMITDSLKRFDQDKEYKVQSQDEVLGSTKTVLAILSSLIFVIAVIAVIMSGIGIMNVMIVAVTDRTKEIGIRKTVGATSKNIFWQFSVEAIMMTLVGGLIGVILSVVASFIIKYFVPIQPIIEPKLIMFALGLSAIVGFIFGTGPAIKASRAEVVSALQTDHT